MAVQIALTLADVATALGRSRSAVRELIANGEFPEGEEVNGRATWLPEDLDWFRLTLLIRKRLKTVTVPPKK